MDIIEKRGKHKTAQINNALGLFISFFGVVVVIAILYTDTLIQQLTNLAAGLVLCGIGGGMILKARKTIKALNMNGLDDV